MEGQEAPPGVVVDGIIENSIKRLKAISFFEPQENTSKEWLEEQSRILLKGINLPTLPVKFLTTPESANEFAWNAKDFSPDWKKAWEYVRQDFLLCAQVIGVKNPKHPWYAARNKAEDVTQDLRDTYGRIGHDASFRSASWAQGETVINKMNKPNPLEPFINVYEKRHALVGVFNNTFGIYTPPLKLV